MLASEASQGFLPLLNRPVAYNTIWQRRVGRANRERGEINVDRQAAGCRGVSSGAVSACLLNRQMPAHSSATPQTPPTTLAMMVPVRIDRPPLTGSAALVPVQLMYLRGCPSECLLVVIVPGMQVCVPPLVPAGYYATGSKAFQ